MKIDRAMDIIYGKPKGFMVSFEHLASGMLTGDYFPDKHAGENLIPTVGAAWAMANEFAKKTTGKCVNIYVTDHDFIPVPGYKNRKIDNR